MKDFEIGANPTGEAGKEWFKQESLDTLRQLLAIMPYPGYPVERLTAENGAYRLKDLGFWHLPDGPWHMPASPGQDGAPDENTRAKLRAEKIGFDSANRPLHPWLEEMLDDPELGVITGKGFFWQWGPNYTADPVIIRHDLEQPHILLITRKDTGQLALPGGFVDGNEAAVDAAAREAGEEALINPSELGATITQIYSGPISDIRITANAWPETTAFRFDMPPESTAGLETGPYKAGDDADLAVWLPMDKIDGQIFGSHKLLINLALRSS